MARAGAPSERNKRQRALDDDERKELEAARRYMRARDELVGELWELDAALGVRNKILQRLQAHLTDDDKQALAGRGGT